MSAVASYCEVRPRRNRDDRAGQGAAFISQPQRQGKRESTAGRVTDESRARGLCARRHAAPPSGKGIVEGGRIRMFRRETIVWRYDARARRFGKAPGDVAVERRRCRRITATVQKKNLLILCSPAFPDEGRRNPAQRGFPGLHATGRRKDPTFIPAQLLTGSGANARP